MTFLCVRKAKCIEPRKKYPLPFFFFFFREAIIYSHHQPVIYSTFMTVLNILNTFISSERQVQGIHNKLTLFYILDGCYRSKGEGYSSAFSVHT